MYKRKRIGLIIWGGILILAGLIMITSAVLGTRTGSTKAGDIFAVFVTALMFFAGGGLMITFGIINCIKVSRYNNELKNRDVRYTARCTFCGYDLICTPEHFKPHRRYPEGYTTCPACKKPLSLNLFKVTVNNNNVT
ncbi:MAG: hypothetical protein IKQ18_04360 [Clostridia bacterium]|nr:hypothetical protein [Clostridia bacterium]